MTKLDDLALHMITYYAADPARIQHFIKVQWQNEQFQTRIRTFTGWTAQIIQHEIDHCEGILI